MSTMRPRHLLLTILLCAASGAALAEPAPPRAVEADFDGDGLTDLATVFGAADDDSGLAIHLSAAGAAAPARVVPTPGTLRDLAAADLDADGIVDLAYLEERRGGVLLSVRLGLGDARFAAERPVIELPGLDRVEIADVDRDGDGDLRLRSADGGSRVLLHDGTGAFETTMVTAPPAGTTEGGGAPLLWNQDWDGQSSYGPSVKSSFADIEIADDFVLEGTVTRLLAQGRQGFPPPPPVEVEGVEVRFYDVAADGRPGQVVAEYLLSAGDPDLSFADGNPSTFDITLSPPFAATGQHFVGVQAVMESVWYRASSNGVGIGLVRGSHIWVKDESAGGTWEIYEDVLGQQLTDITFELYGDLTAPPVITGISDPEPLNSGRLRILGHNLGGTRNGGSVAVGGRPAWIAEWTDREIHAYVPEGIAGPSDVEITTVAGTGAPEPVDVRPRGQEGQVRWRFACDSIYARHRVGIGPDGTVYVQDVEAILYALSPDGALEWLVDLGDEGSEGPVAVGADGTVYVSVNPLGPEAQIVAVNPDGSVKWTFTTTDTQGVIAGPGVGPDGNVYAVFEQPGIGAVSLDPQDGTLLWSHPGDPVFNEYGQRGIELGFGADRFYFGFDERAVNPIALLYGFSLDGEQLFAVGRPDDGAYPVVGPDGSVYVRTWVGGAGIRLGSYDPDGDLQWIAFESPTNTLTDPDVGPDGAIYAIRNLRELWALETDGSTRWTVTSDGWLGRPIVAPQGDRLLVGGYELGQYGFFRAFDTNGTVLWDQILPLDPDGAILGHSAPARFSADGSTAYVPVSRNWNNDVDEHCYVYALAAPPAGAGVLFTDGFESGDTSAWSVTQQ